MELNPMREIAKKILTERLVEIEKYFDADCLFYYGQITEGNITGIHKLIIELADERKHTSLIVILTTGGGSILAVERFVNLLRYHYSKIIFVVPDYAYSAGTIFCMSGDELYMDYYGVLGPIDPQVQNKDGKWVAALGYLDKINNMIEKSLNNELSPAEYLILKEFDLGTLREYEQARNHSKDLLIKYLVDYKFKNWSATETRKETVTLEMKHRKAAEIAERLGSNEWYSHGRPINIVKLTELGIRVHDYSDETELKKILNDYYYPMVDFLNDGDLFIHTRRFF